MSNELEQLPDGPFTILVLNGQPYTISEQNGQCHVSRTDSITSTPTPTPPPAPPER